ncbi:MAG TPA: translation initiation factor IF-2 associated domain-containing protein, partial [Hyphomonadaceae bacterium]|nr:translation initiation factor IF-2 associated domain-containing protein [Hyphomonadaceae bacterium]
MSDTKDNDNSQRRPLTLKRADTGTVKQSFSHGRSKQVAVEVKKKKVVVSPGTQKVVRPEPEKPAEKAPTLTAAQEAIQNSRLSEAELKARQAALAVRRADD